jgi:dihydrofolate reductase
MRKLKLQVQISVDGFVATGPNDDQKWVTWAWDEIRPHVLGLLDTSDTILIGRKLAVDYIPYWQDVNTKPDDPMHEVAQRIVRAKKVVFTKTLEKSEWANTELATGNLADEIRNLKNRSGKDLIVYGGSSFVASIIKEGLIDEFHLFVNPVALGHGWPIFSQLESTRQLKLKNSIVYDCGIVMLHYEPKTPN